MDETLLQAALWPGVPLWGMFLVVLVTAIKVMPPLMERWLDHTRLQAAEKAADWNRLREELARLDAFRQAQLAENEKCRNDLAMAVKRIAELEGYILGQGKARQDAARIVAVERIADKIEKNGEDGK